jgi:hypothetical protein
MAGAAGHGGAAGVGGGGSGGAGGTGGVAGAGGDDYHVAIDAERTTVCPGQCVQLLAEAKNGHQPYRYAWSAELGDGAGPHEACPERTTTYSVTATDTSSDGEFGHKSEAVSASIEIRVDEDCDDPDGGVKPPEGTALLCSLRIPYKNTNGEQWISTFTGWEGNSNIATDRDGNAYIPGVFRGTFQVGELTMTSVGVHDAFVIKLDSSCTPLWIKTFGAPEVQISLDSLAVAPDGDLAAGGMFSGVVDLGQGLLTSGLNGSALLVKLDDSSGAVLWTQAYVSLLYTTSIWDVGIDDAGDIVFAGQGATDVSFGGAVLGGGTGPNVAFLAKVSSAGAHRFSFPIESGDFLAPFALHRSGVIALTGWGTQATVTINGEAIALSDDAWKRYVALLDSSGDLLWGRELEEPEEWMNDDYHGYWGTGIAIDEDRNIVVEHGHLIESPEGGWRELPERLSKLDASGTLLWAKDFDEHTDVEVFYGEGGLAVDSRGNIIHTDEGGDPSTLTPSAQDAGVTPRNLLYVRKLTPDGDLIWEHVFDDATAQWIWGITTGPDDAVWIAHASEESTNEIIGALVITKLAP